MSLAGLIVIALGAAVLFGPALWARWVMARHGGARGGPTGAALARTLLDAEGLHRVRVESSDRGDHYDPGAKAVRLAPERYDGRSLTAVVVAAHEVGHAIQDARGYRPLRWRQRLVGAAGFAERIGVGLLIASPVAVAVTRRPGAGLVAAVLGVVALGVGAGAHLMALPVELDASFGRALPLLRRRGDIAADELPAARRILTAAAFTYVAGAVAKLGGLWRWARWLGR